MNVKGFKDNWKTLNYKSKYSDFLLPFLSPSSRGDNKWLSGYQNPGEKG